MTIRRCVRCDSTNVDYEGYCWTCEYQDPSEGQDSPAGGGGADAVARRGAKASAKGRSGLARLLVMTVAPLTTLALIGCVVAAVVVFERADAVVGARATPPVTAPSGSGDAGTGGDAATCVVGTWRLVATDATFSLRGAGSFHGTGAGGTLTFAADGTGRFDYTGWSINGIMNGATVVMTAAGVETFRYRLEGARLRYEQSAGGVTATVQSHGQTPLSEPLARPSALAENAIGCAGTVLTARRGGQQSGGSAGAGAAGSGGAGPGGFSETYTRLS